jgi:hypothetical protein
METIQPRLRIGIAIYSRDWGHIRKVRMNLGLFGGQPSRGIVNQKLFEQVQTIIVEGRDECCRRIAHPFGERGLEVWEGCDSRPVVFGGRTEDAFYVLVRYSVRHGEIFTGKS